MDQLVARVFVWGRDEFRPAEGWLPFLMLAGAVITFVLGILEASWVPRDDIVGWTAFVGFVLGLLLAKKGRLVVGSWVLIVAYIIVTTFLALIRFSPMLLVYGREFFLSETRSNALALALSLLRWMLNVMRGVQGQGTAAFTILMGVLTGILVAYLVWSTYRQQQPLRGLALMGVVLAFNEYYGGGQGNYLIVFIGLMAGTTVLQNYGRREIEWVRRQIDYSDQIQMEAAVVAAVLSLGLLLVTAVVPSIPVTRWVQAFQELTVVRETEATLERVFGGVQANEAPEAAVQYAPPSGLLPTSYLLGDAPELTAIEIFEGQIFTADGETAETTTVGLHWRGAVYDVYTGSGWMRSEMETVNIEAGEQLPVRDTAAQQTITQTVRWVSPSPLVNFYTMGQPRQLDIATQVSHWSGGDVGWVTVPSAFEGDFGARGYTAVSQLSAATAAQLRQSRVADVPPEIIAQYTQLPDDLPVRVREMGRQLTADFDNPYDQARAIEAFLRQYPYNLQVPTPPRGFDPVDYFLFELQEGYCDYYASSMVVLARSVGLPARLAAGYLAQRPDENGVQTITQKNGHSWAEIYFAGYGWVEFEPTAAFPLAAQAGVGSPEFDFGLQEEDTVPGVGDVPIPAIPEPETAEVQYWQWVILLLPVFAILGYWVWQRRQMIVQERDGVVWSFGRLQWWGTRLGRPPVESETAQEFGQALVAQLDEVAGSGEGRSKARPLFKPIVQAVQGLVSLYEQRLYGQDKPAEAQQRQNAEAQRMWQMAQRPLWRLWLRQLFGRRRSE